MLHARPLAISAAMTTGLEELLAVVWKVLGIEAPSREAAPPTISLGTDQSS
jgi:hypothetical protein